MYHCSFQGIECVLCIFVLLWRLEGPWLSLCMGLETGRGNSWVRDASSKEETGSWLSTVLLARPRAGICEQHLPCWFVIRPRDISCS